MGYQRVETAPRLHSAELLLWLYLAATAMLFAGFTSAYLVQRFSENWQTFPIPGVFWLNTTLLILSSYTLFWARRGYKVNNPWQIQVGLMATFGLGVFFLVGQVIGWRLLVHNGFFLAGNHKAVSYFYVFSGLHALHLVAGLIVLGYWLFRAFRYQVAKQTELGFRLASTFWHALGVLWVYLIVFLQVNQLF
ncbi:MAG: cytochrome c oxidase subunit 3 [Bacteroidia bacterium]|nr:cytochrome c oxidase subunit 3 [Bacteroidia bacterium]MDW8088138.1 cytochrome c oxidase subunit 3 [Bacteroidia bacterium]